MSGHSPKLLLEAIVSQNISLSTKEMAIAEQHFQLLLNKYFEGELEWSTKAGRIDILSDEHLIEVKEASRWKEGIGQLFSYSVYEPGRTLVLVLFGYAADSVLEVIQEVCSKLNITLICIGASFELKVIPSLSDQKIYSAERLIKDRELSSRNIYADKLRLRKSIVQSNSDKTGTDIAKLIQEKEPLTKLSSLIQWISRERNKGLNNV